MRRQYYLVEEEVRRSIEWLITRLVKVGARESYDGRRRYVHEASTFLLARQYRAVFEQGARAQSWLTGWARAKYARRKEKASLSGNGVAFLPL